MQGTVVRVTGKVSSVQVDGAGGGGPAPERRSLRCVLRGSLRGRGRGAHAPVSTIAAGDRVEVTETEPGEGVIESVAPRLTKLARKAAGEGPRDREQVIAANVDQLVIVAAAREPALKRGLIDRLLVAAENGGLRPLIVVTKVDLLDGAEERAAVARDLAPYEAPPLGHRVILASSRTGEGLPALRSELASRISVFAGASGVGKSSLLNAIEPGLRLRTGEISRSTGKGRHVTAAVSLLPLSAGGYVVDTPGVREFGIFDVSPAELPHLFRDLAAFAPSCRYGDCSHTAEPGCAVKTALERGELDRGRYESYVRLRESVAESR